MQETSKGRKAFGTLQGAWEGQWYCSQGRGYTWEGQGLQGCAWEGTGSAGADLGGLAGGTAVLIILTLVPFSHFKCRKSKKKKSAPSILSSGRVGQVGKFKNGTLILSQVDIKKINSSRVAK